MNTRSIIQLKCKYIQLGKDIKIMKKEYILEGLCCGNCATKIERDVQKLDVISANLDFVSKILRIEISNDEMINARTEQVKKIVKLYESDVVVIEKEEMYSFQKKEKRKEFDWKRFFYWLTLGTGAGIFTIVSIFELSPILELVLYLASYFLVGGEVVLRAIKNICKGQVFDENFLMSVATIGAFAIGEYAEGVAVMLFYQVGELFQHLAVNRSRKSISALMDIRPDFANLKIGDETRKVAPEEVKIGDLIFVKPGEKLPLDGKVIEGISALDTSALTGEALPRDVEVGSEVLSGSINKNGLLLIEVTKAFGESTISKILDLVQNASSKKAVTENFITKFARYYTPFVVFSALVLAIIPPLIIQEATFTQWINRALVFLVVSCPCALVISIPLGFFGGIGGASQNGILVKGSNFLEALNAVETVVFDKTGTLTKGIFKVTKISALNDWPKEELLNVAAHAESYSNHPIATSILKEFGNNIDTQRIAEYEEIPGQGIRVKVDKREVLAGNDKMMKAQDIAYKSADMLGTVVYLAVENVFIGYIVISDEVKGDSKQAIRNLKAMGVKNIAMLTGDSKVVGEQIAQELGIDKVYSELLPHQKVEQMERLEQEKSEKGKLVFVGDGINDAPVLARADIGMAMGGVGSDAAIEAADVVLMTDEPSKIVTAIHIARKTRNIVWQNIIFALGVKAIILVLGAVGIASMWMAVFGDVGVAVIAILNAMRVMRVSSSKI